MDPLPEAPAKYNQPWKQKEGLIVIDAYQGNPIDWDKMATDSRVVGVIHRASIGLTEDTQYKTRKNLALKRGYLWGAYHLGRSGDPVEQARYFLKVLDDHRDTMIALDLEDTSNSSMMNIPNAVKFMEYIYQSTSRVPIVYANHSVTQALNVALAKNDLFKRSLLWYARFKSSLSDFPKGIWNTYFLWQFSSEINCSNTGSCLYNVPGTAFDMDINVFYGSLGSLRERWLL